MKFTALSFMSLALASVLLASCSASGQLNAGAASDLQSALAIGCPIVSTIKASAPNLNAYQQSALTTLALACPPNPPPSNAVIATSDIIAAATTLAPLLK